MGIYEINDQLLDWLKIFIKESKWKELLCEILLESILYPKWMEIIKNNIKQTRNLLLNSFNKKCPNSNYLFEK